VYKSYALVVRNWGMENLPDRDTVSSTIRRFQSTGNANPPKKPGRSPSVLDDGGMEMVSCSLEEEPELSVRKRAQMLEMAPSTVGRAIKSLGFHAYRCQIVHELKDMDIVKRMEFSEIWLRMLRDDQSLEDRILWTDECWFGLDEAVNTRNCYYYSQTNPHYTREISLAQEGVMAWCGISSIGIVGPFFLPFESHWHRISSHALPLDISSGKGIV